MKISVLTRGYAHVAKKPSETTETTKTSETPIVSQAIFFETPVVASTTGHTSLLSVSPAVSEFSAERSSKESTLPTLPTQRPRCSSTKQVPPLRKLYCPICRQSPFHYHYACPIVLGDLDPLEQRVSEMNEEDHSETLMQVMEGHIVSARKRTKAAESSHAVSNSMLLSQELSLGDEGGSGEGSKNVDEESEESSEEGSDDSSTIVKVQSTCLNSSLKPPVTVPLDADTQLEILIRGPVQPSRSILADIPSDSDTSSDSDAMDTEDPEREDQENDRSFRKLEKCLHSNQSSSDEEQGARGDEDEESLTFMDVSPKERISQVSELQLRVFVMLKSLQPRILAVPYQIHSSMKTLRASDQMF